MKTYLVLVCVATYFGLTTISLEARKVSALHADILLDEASADANNGTSEGELGDDVAPIPRQEEPERPYEYVPRVFHSLRKIIKGVLNGSIHEVFQGSFSFAPKEVSNEIIGIYNQVVGLPDPVETPRNTTLEELLEGEEEEEEAIFAK